MNARKHTLPQYTVTHLADNTDACASTIRLVDGSNYSTIKKVRNALAYESSDASSEAPMVFNTYPLVLLIDGRPWDEANLFIYKSVEEAVDPQMTTFSSLADDLTGYRRFLDDENLDWLDFPRNKNARPTYRYRSYLNHKVWQESLSLSTARRKIGAVVRFYRWLMKNGLFEPENPPWRDAERLIASRTPHGRPVFSNVQSTDLRITVANQEDPYSQSITDGGKLRPLAQTEQEWLIDALLDLGNTEMTLVHLFALLTGARIQTVLTFRVSHVIEMDTRGKSVLCPVGPGTGIDTKHNKRMTLHVPTWFLEMLKTYALSERARRRRRAAIGGDTDKQYLFLSKLGMPFYLSRQDLSNQEIRHLRYRVAGQAVREFIKDYAIPKVRSCRGPSFSYRFHDLRATFGMNLVDWLTPLVQQGEMTYTSVLNVVRTRLGHDSIATTEGYLRYRTNQKLLEDTQRSWEGKLQELAGRAMRAFVQ